MEKHPSSQKKQSNAWVKYLGMATQMAVVIGIFVYGGQLLDKKLNTSFLIIITSLLGVGLSMFIMIRTVTDKKK